MSELELWCSTMRRADLVQLAEAAGGAGFGAITSTPRLFASAPLTGAALRRHIEACGVRVSWIDGLCTALPGTPPASRSPGFAGPHDASFDDCVRIAHDLGAEGINLVHIGGTPQPIALLGDTFGETCRRAAREGLRLAIEFLPGTGIPDLLTGLAVVRAAGEGNGSVLLDSWHLARSGGSIDQLDAGSATLIGALQLSDRTPDQDLAPYVPMTGRKLPGDGALPLGRIVAAVLAAHPQLPVGVEVLSDEMEAMSFDEAAHAAARATRGVIAAAAAGSGGSRT